MNPTNFIKNYMLKGLTPKGIVKQMAGNNPIFNNLISMAEKRRQCRYRKFCKERFKRTWVKL